MFKEVVPKLKRYFSNKQDVNYISSKEVRIGLIAAIIVYAVFGIVDWFMLPQNYLKAWIIRVIMVFPAILILLFFSENKTFMKYIKVILTLLILGGQLGILAMIYVAEPNELARFEYFMGMILVLLWAGFVFRLSIVEMLFVCISNIILYNVVAIFVQNLPFNSFTSREFAYFINNNFLMISASILAAVGSNQLNKFYVRIQEQNLRLEKEKEALKIAKIKAEESDRLKTAFLANISHEIRTPMNGILGFTELLKKGNLNEIKEKKYMDVIQNKGRQLEKLLNDLIDLAKIEANEISLNMSTIDINLFIDEMCFRTEELLITQDKINAIEVKKQKGSPNKTLYYKTDIIRLRQIISNLLYNAVKFTKQGHIEFGYLNPINNTIEFYVKDTGIGISEEHQQIVFERFRQVEDAHTKNYEGTGLGLSIVNNLVSLLQGTVKLESQLGEGSTFRVVLPFK